MRFAAALAVIVTASFWPAAARAEIRLPDCGALAAWARNLDFKTERRLNPYKTYAYLEAFLDAEMVALYGKAASEFTADEAAQAGDAAGACGKTADKADRKVIAGVERQFVKVVGPLAKYRAEALAELAAAIEAFTATPPGMDKLRMIAAVRAIAEGDSRGVSAGISRDGRKVLDGVIRPMQMLPLEMAATQVAPAMDGAEAASLNAAMEEVRAEYAALEASEQTLRRWDATVEKIERPVAPLLPPESAARLNDLAMARRTEIEAELAVAQISRLDAMGPGAVAIAEIDRAANGSLARQLSTGAAEAFRQALAGRRQALALALVRETPIGPNTLNELPRLEAALTQAPGGLVSDADQVEIRAAIADRKVEATAVVVRSLLAGIAATKIETGAFATIDRFTQPHVLTNLAAADAAAVRAAAETKRAEVGKAVTRLMQDELDRLQDDEQALKIIDTALLPGATALPSSAGVWRDGLVAAVAARRNAILASITRQQRGPLKGRAYATRDGSMKVEFRDNAEAYVTDRSGQTVVAAYKTIGDEAVTLSLPQATVVLTREGRWLVGGPLQLQRIDEAQ